MDWPLGEPTARAQAQATAQAQEALVREQGQAEHGGTQPQPNPKSMTKRKRSSTDEHQAMQDQSRDQDQATTSGSDQTTPLDVFEGLTTQSSASSSCVHTSPNRKKQKSSAEDKSRANAKSGTEDSANDSSSPTITKKRPRGRPRILDLPRMNNSERGKFYRRKKQQYVEGLQTQVTTLRRVVDDLHAWSRLRRAGPTKGALLQIVRELFRQFRFGLQRPATNPDISPSGNAAANQNQNSAQSVEWSTSQKLFVDLMLTKKVRVGDCAGGLELLLEQLRLYSTVYARVQVELSSVTAVIGHQQQGQVNRNHTRRPLVCAKGRLALVFGEQTLETLFGLDAMNAGPTHQMARMLLHKGMQVPFQSSFAFAEDGRIDAIEFQLEYVMALLALLGDDVRGVHELLQMARMTSRFAILKPVNAPTQSDTLSVAATSATADADADADATTPTPTSRMHVDYLLS